jgi:hypothetical protein
MALATASGLWIVNRIHISRIYNNTTMTIESLWAEWCALSRETLLAKRPTAVECDTLVKPVLDEDIC